MLSILLLGYGCSVWFRRQGMQKFSRVAWQYDDTNITCTIELQNERISIAPSKAYFLVSLNRILMMYFLVPPNPPTLPQP